LIAGLVLLAVLGLAVGTVVNLAIERMPDGGSPFSSGPSCPECDAPRSGIELVPVVGWAVRSGRCHACAVAIPAGYPLVEVANAALWVVAGITFGADWVLVPFLFLFSVLLAQAVIDLELYRLLDRITFPALAISVVALALVSITDEEPKARLLGALIGGVGYFVFLLVPALISPKGMGLGDVKLAALMGLYLGYIDPFLVFYAVLAACALGIGAGAILFFVRGRSSRAFPFGPWLALGCILAIVFHETLLQT
jgi:leader peptidase (prepilin peptidase) / N-methyltransferase